VTTFRLVQPAAAPDSPIALCYLIGPGADAALRAGLPGCEIRATAEAPLAPAAPPAGRDVVLVGWSGGCQPIRAHLIAGVEPLAVVALDGTAGSWPYLADYQIEPWRRIADDARARRRCAVLTCTDQTYTETLPAGQAFAATIHVLEHATGLDLTPGVEIEDGDLHVWPYPSATIDKDAHIRQVTQVLPRALAVVGAWLGARGAVTMSPEEAERLTRIADDVAAGRTDLDDALAHASTEAPQPEAVPDTLPSPPANPSAVPNGSTRGERLLAWMRAEQAAGVREVPAGSNTGPRIRQYLAACVRDGRAVGIAAGPWCAASATFGADAVREEGDRPIPVRAAGIEVEQDAIAAGEWHPAADVVAGRFAPKVGDLVVCERPGAETWSRHVCVVSQPYAGAAVSTVGGNEGDEFGDAVRPLPGSVRGFVSV
jgi:hypothetical protein